MFAVHRQAAGSRQRRSGQRPPGRAPAAALPIPDAQRASCACGGSCPRCQAKPTPAKLRVSHPGDRYEQQADSVADAVMRAPDAGHGHGVHSASPAPPLVQREITPARADTASASVNADIPGALGAGHPLPRPAREFFEPRFGRDFNSVRLHTDARARELARSVDARAFTFGHNVVFGAGEYDPSSTRGRSLLAHELAHVEQQERGASYIQRSLTVSPTRPSDTQDPFSRMGASAFRTMAFSEMDTIINSLCDAFTVDSSGNVVSSADACTDRGAVAGGAKGVGCCCLCTLTDPSAAGWTINVVGLAGPHTEPASATGGGGGQFFLHPSTSTFEFGSWDVTGGRSMYDPILVAGHELCGHGALIERDIHPDVTIERVDTDVHDPTVNIENAIAAEQGSSKPDRALAAGGHRGESFGRVTIRNYPFNGTSVPAGERPKIQLAKDFIRANNTWVDIFGHSDRVGSNQAKLDVSQERADKVKHALTHGARRVTNTISETFATGATNSGSVTISGDRFTNVEGRSDFDQIPAATDDQLRRVDIIMPSRPAGADTPNAGTPTNVDHVGPRSVLSFIRRRFLGNACDRLLARTAWF